MSDFAIMIAAVAGGAAVAGFVQGLSGFAFSLVAMSLWTWVLPPSIAAPLAVFGALLGQVASFGSFRSGYDFRRILPLVAGGALGVPFGVLLLHNADPIWFRLTVGTLLTVYSLFLLLLRDPPVFAWGGRGVDAAAGLFGGILGGLGGMAGAVPALWTSLRGWKPDVRRATMQVFNITMHVLTLMAYASTGTLDDRAIRLFVLVAPAMLIPSYVGARLYRRFSEAAFTRFVLVLLLISGLALAIGAVQSLRAQ
jgi:uncharacterized membrane protein YfcA